MHFEPAVMPAAEPSSTAWSFAFVEGQILMPQHEAALAPGAPMQAGVRLYMGRLGGVEAWALAVDSVPNGWHLVPLRAAMMAMPAPQAGAAARAWQLIEWDRTHRFCGVCGTPTERVAHERGRRCPSCKHIGYPRVTPAMMVLVWRPGQVLLARAPHFVNRMYSALAGFVEPGESLEDCVHREVAEEVGVRIADLRYYGSQSWPFPHSLMLAFTARWSSGEIVMQADEIEDARWFALDALPAIPPRFSISGHLIRDTVEALERGRLG